MQIWALIVDSFRETRNRKIFSVMIGISLFIAAAMACIEIGPDGINMLFGTWTFDTAGWGADDEQARSLVATLSIKLIADLYLGWIGIILALVATASIFPSLMERGAIDLVLSKPISRHAVFLGKYAGAMVFVLVQSTVFVGVTFVVIGTRWHQWLWGYLWLIPLMVILFSYVFAFSALFAVVTRSGMTSLLLTLLAWVAIYIPQEAYGAMLTMPQIDESGRWTRLIKTVKWIVPKTQDIPLIAGKLVGAGLVLDVFPIDETDPDVPAKLTHARDGERRLTEEAEPISSIGSSLAFEAVIVLLAMWKFKRRDF